MYVYKTVHINIQNRKIYILGTSNVVKNSIGLVLIYHLGTQYIFLNA